MKFKKGNPITSVDDLVNEFNNGREIYQGDSLVKSEWLWYDPFAVIVTDIENRNFFYAVEDDE